MSVEEKVLDQTHFETLLREAEIYFEQGLYQEARDTYTKLLDLLNQMPPAKELAPQKSVLEEKISQINQLLEQQTQIKISKEKSIEDLYQEAIALKELGLYKEAIDELNKLIKTLCKNRKETHLLSCLDVLIECYKKESQVLECINLLENIISQYTLSASILDVLFYNLGILYENIGGYYKSLFYLKKIKNTKAFSNLKEKIKAIELKLKNVTRFDYLLKQKLITPKDLKKASIIAKKENKSIEYILLDKFKIPKKEIGRSLSLFYQCDFYSFSPNVDIPKNLIKDIKKEFLQNNLWVPLRKEKDRVLVLIDDPYDLGRTDIIKKFFKEIKLAVAIKEDILKFINYFWENLHKATDSVKNLLEDFQELVVEEELAVSEEELILSDSKIVKFVNDMILDAWKRNASDIHIEPCPLTHKTDIRFRIDGVCQHYASIPNKVTKEIVSRIKIMANLDITEKRLPQDGKIKFVKDGKLLVELRVATLPTVGNLEDVVLRLLHTGTPMKLEDLGMPSNVLEEFRKIVKRPYGLILVVGPTGSGKTTTLHSVLHYINTPEIKIWTAEDPVEITQRGLRQIEVNPKIGLTFAKVMRAFLRADPDVIMIGEMRDRETANTAIEASLTGHLVLSTLHTNTAPETVTRLLEMGLDPHNFADSLLGILAQRLVRKLCNECKREYHPSKEEFDEIIEEYGRELFDKRIGLKYTSDLVLYRPAGCEHCGNTGYKGRIGIYELLLNNNEVKSLIKKKAPTEQIRKVAIQSGMITLKQDGISKIFQGITDIREVRRVCME